GGFLLGAGQFVEALLALPDIVAGGGALAVLDLREVLPGLATDDVQVLGTGDELLLVEDQSAAQHAAQILAGLHHVLEDGLALAKRGIRIHTLTTGQQQCGNHQQAYNLVRRHEAKPWCGKEPAGDYPRPARQGKPQMMSGLFRAIPSDRRSSRSRASLVPGR